MRMISWVGPATVYSPDSELSNRVACRCRATHHTRPTAMFLPSTSLPCKERPRQRHRTPTKNSPQLISTTPSSVPTQPLQRALSPGKPVETRPPLRMIHGWRCRLRQPSAACGGRGRRCGIEEANVWMGEDAVNTPPSPGLGNRYFVRIRVILKVFRLACRSFRALFPPLPSASPRIVRGDWYPLSL